VNNQELLIDHLDQTLQGGSIPEAVRLIQSDESARGEWQYLQIAVEAVQHNALQAQVAAIRAEMQGAAGNISTGRRTDRAEGAGEDQHPGTVPVRRIMRNILRVAAAIVLLAGSLVVYKWVTVTSSGFYEEYYASYQLPTSRGEVSTGQLEQLYRNADWNGVNAAYNILSVKTNKDHFLAGMAALELKQIPEAIARFVQVLDNNAATGDNYFQDEAEYYLALAYIAHKETAKAMPLLKKIGADKNHTYYQKVKDMSGADLKILELK
jgi:hypothetical protein